MRLRSLSPLSTGAAVGGRAGAADVAADVDVFATCRGGGTAGEEGFPGAGEAALAAGRAASAVRAAGRAALAAGRAALAVRAAVGARPDAADLS